MTETVIEVLPYTRERAAWNLALEEALFLKAQERMKQTGTFNPIIRIYSFSKPVVVLGYQQRIEEIDSTYCAQEDIDVTMRKTGGGSVYLSDQEVQYSLILPQYHTMALLGNINQRLIAGLADVGFSPQLKSVDNHPVIRMKGRSFVFDAQRRAILYNGDALNPKYTLLHHGTILVDDSTFGHMPYALRADAFTTQTIQKGNFWLRQEQHIALAEVIRALIKNLAVEGKIVHRDYTAHENRLAQELHESFYLNPTMVTTGKKQFGICYRPDTAYNMGLYAEEEVIHGAA